MRVLLAYVLAAALVGGRDLPVLCPFRRLTGRACPACGLTRSIAAIARGRLRVAVRLHPAGPAVLAATAWFLSITIKDGARC